MLSRSRRAYSSWRASSNRSQQLPQKKRVLCVKEHNELSTNLKSLDQDAVCAVVETTVSAGLHFVCYPEKKAFWESIRGTAALRSFIAAASHEFVQLYETCGRGANKYARFFRSWLEYMLTHTRDQPSASSKELWGNLAKCYSQTVSNDIKRVILCEILHSLQHHLQRTLIIELEDRCEDNSTKTELAVGSNDTALYRIGGWALLSAAKFRQKHIRQNTGNIKDLREELHILKALQLPNELKAHVPVGLKYLVLVALTGIRLQPSF